MAPTQVTQGLLQRFSERRIVDAPIAEMGSPGIGVGAGDVRAAPIIEFMTFNFSLVAIEIRCEQTRPKSLPEGSSGQYNIPDRVPRPSGPAVQSGSQHSQALESYYAHVPGLKVVMPLTALDAKGLLKSAIATTTRWCSWRARTLYNTTGRSPTPRAAMT